MNSILLDALISELISTLVQSCISRFRIIKKYFTRKRIAKIVKEKFENNFLKEYKNELFYDKLDAFLCDANFCNNVINYSFDHGSVIPGKYNDLDNYCKEIANEFIKKNPKFIDKCDSIYVCLNKLSLVIFESINNYKKDDASLAIVNVLRDKISESTRIINDKIQKLTDEITKEIIDGRNETNDKLNQMIKLLEKNESLENPEELIGIIWNVLANGEIETAASFFDKYISQFKTFNEIKNDIELLILFFKNLDKFKSIFMLSNNEIVNRLGLTAGVLNIKDIKNLDVEEQKLIDSKIKVSWVNNDLEIEVDGEKINLPENSIVWGKFFFEGALSNNSNSIIIAKTIYEKKKLPKNILFDLLYDNLNLYITNDSISIEKFAEIILDKKDFLLNIDAKYRKNILNNLFSRLLFSNRQLLTKVINNLKVDDDILKKYELLLKMHDDFKNVKYEQVHSLCESQQDYYPMSIYFSLCEKNEVSIKQFYDKDKSLCLKSPAFLVAYFDLIEDNNEKIELLEYAKSQYFDNFVYLCLKNITKYFTNPSEYIEDKVPSNCLTDVYSCFIYLKMLFTTKQYSRILEMYDNNERLPIVLKLQIAEYLSKVDEEKELYLEKAVSIYKTFDDTELSMNDLINYYNCEKQLFNTNSSMRILERLFDISKDYKYLDILLDLRVKNENYTLDSYVEAGMTINQASLLYHTGLILSENNKTMEAIEAYKKCLLLTSNEEILVNYFYCIMGTDYKFEPKTTVVDNTTIFLSGPTNIIICCYNKEYAKLVQNTKLFNVINTYFDSSFIKKIKLSFSSVGDEILIDGNKYIIKEIQNLDQYIYFRAMNYMESKGLIQSYSINEENGSEKLVEILKKISPKENWYKSTKYEKIKFKVPFSKLAKKDGSNIEVFTEKYFSKDFALMPVYASDITNKTILLNWDSIFILYLNKINGDFSISKDLKNKYIKALNDELESLKQGMLVGKAQVIDEQPYFYKIDGNFKRSRYTLLNGLIEFINRQKVANELHDLPSCSIEVKEILADFINFEADLIGLSYEQNMVVLTDDIFIRSLSNLNDVQTMSIIDFLYDQYSSIEYLEKLNLIYNFNKYIEFNDVFFYRLKDIWSKSDKDVFKEKLKDLLLLRNIQIYSKKDTVGLQMHFLHVYLKDKINDKKMNISDMPLCFILFNILNEYIDDNRK